MNFSEGLEKALLDKDLPVVTFYDLYVLGHRLFQSKTWQGEPLKRMPQAWDQQRAKSAAGRLEARRAIVEDADFSSNVWRVTQATRAGSAEEVVCIADPFAYVSHLSAMQKYGFTDRSPQALHITTPKRDIWNTFRKARAEQDLPDERSLDRAVLHRPGFRDTIRRRPVVVHVSSHPWVPSKVSGEETRITSVGQTFADMLLEPRLCGGMRHVLDVWENEAGDWIDEIIATIEKTGSKIAKVRAGYIISDILNIDHPVAQKWEEFAQRGGSRRLDPDAEYSAEFSERWMLSINV
ncbi:MAG: hypothetical protein BEV12_24110 [Microcystis aeruginosa CACIAM 03]|nr:MAG: hypothetical protein BEV12_24110 [Microcystis aeruginosa CACIAM 03]